MHRLLTKFSSSISYNFRKGNELFLSLLLTPEEISQAFAVIINQETCDFHVPCRG